MKVLVTGGAGFIGRWVVKNLLDKGHQVIAFDNLSNGREKNIAEFTSNPNFEFVKGDIIEAGLVNHVFDKGVELCIHLAAQIEVQESLDTPEKSFNSNIIGTYNILEECRKRNIKISVMGTCMVYDLADTSEPITEKHPVKPASPYAGTKVAAELLAESYYHSYKLPVVIMRPFNTYGPFQKTSMEGGVVAIFIKKKLAGEDLKIFGDGTQTRDLLYVEDCADFVVTASLNEKAVGQVINAGLGRDVSINELAKTICSDESKIKHVEHHHPQSEIPKLVCNYSKAKELLNWEPRTSLEEGIRKTEEWIKENDL